VGYHILYIIYTRDMMDYVLASSDVDLVLPHSLHYLYINKVKNAVTEYLPHSRRGHNPSYP
jgi:hypothetical protein